MSWNVLDRCFFDTSFGKRYNYITIFRWYKYPKYNNMYLMITYVCNRLISYEHVLVFLHFICMHTFLNALECFLNAGGGELVLLVLVWWCWSCWSLVGGLHVHEGVRVELRVASVWQMFFSQFVFGWKMMELFNVSSKLACDKNGGKTTESLGWCISLCEMGAIWHSNISSSSFGSKKAP